MTATPTYLYRRSYRAMQSFGRLSRHPRGAAGLLRCQMSGNLEADGGAKRVGCVVAARAAAAADKHEAGGNAAISRRSPIPSCAPILINSHTGFRSGKDRVAHPALSGRKNRRTEQLTFGRKKQHIGTGMLASLAIHALANGRLNQLSQRVRQGFKHIMVQPVTKLRVHPAVRTRTAVHTMRR